MEEKNYYEILEVTTDATSQEINQGYVRAKNAYSQDSLALYSLMTENECKGMLERIDEAYTILNSPTKRKLYDEARGINPTSSQNDSIISSESFEPIHNEENSKQHRSIGKLVAKKRYALNYQEDNDMEQKIEQATEFTGHFLKEIREYKEVNIERMADMTKVSKTYLMNIESEDYTKLPVLVYVRGFVYQYAKCLKLNPDLVATSYLYRLKKLKEEGDNS